MKRREQESNGGMLSEDGELKRVEREEGERAGTMEKREVETEMEEERGGQVWQQGSHRVVTVGNKQSIPATHVGSVVIEGPVGPFLLTNVLYAPGISRNLLSTLALNRLGYSITFEPDESFVVQDAAKSSASTAARATASPSSTTSPSSNVCPSPSSHPPPSLTPTSLPIISV